MKKYDSMEIVFVVLVISLIIFAMFVRPKPRTAEALEDAKSYLPKIMFVESGGDKFAYNVKTDCVGLYQIQPRTALADYNKAHKTAYYREDLFDERINQQVAEWYFLERIPQMLKALDLPDTLSTRIASWNWGIGNTVKWYKAGADFNKLPKETQNFIRRLEQ